MGGVFWSGSMRNLRLYFLPVLTLGLGVILSVSIAERGFAQTSPSLLQRAEWESERTKRSAGDFVYSFSIRTTAISNIGIGSGGEIAPILENDSVTRQTSGNVRVGFNNYFTEDWSWGVNVLVSSVSYENNDGRLVLVSESGIDFSDPSNIQVQTLYDYETEEKTVASNSGQVRLDYRVIGGTIGRRFWLGSSERFYARTSGGAHIWGRSSNANDAETEELDGFRELTMGLNLGAGLVYQFNPAFGISGDVEYYDLGDSGLAFFGLSLTVDPLRVHENWFGR